MPDPTPTTNIDTLAATIRAGLDADEWNAQEAGGGRFESTDYLWDTRYLIVKLPSGKIQHTTEFSADLARHIERHDPYRVLRDVAVKRRLLDLLLAEPHEPGRTNFDGLECSAIDPATRALGCDCGRDERVAGYLAVLAEAYGETT